MKPNPHRPRPTPALGVAAYREEDFPALRLARSGRLVRRIGRVLLALLVISVLAMFFAPWQQSIRGEGAVVAFDPFERPQSIQAPVKGRIAERGDGVWENAYVKKGQLLFRIEDQDPDYLGRLERQVANAQTEIDIARERLKRAEDARDNSAEIVKLTNSQIGSQTQAMTDLSDSLNAEIEQARNKLSAANSKLVDAEAKLWQVDLDYQRKTRLADKGIEAGVSQQIAEQKYKSAKAGVAIAKQEIEGANNGVAAKLKARDSKMQEGQVKIDDLAAKREKARADLAKAEIDIRKNSEEIAQKDTKLLDLQRKLAVQQTQEVRAPRDGYVMDLAVFDEASIVKPGEKLCRIVPETKRPAVQVWVSGNDAPLIQEGRHVRLQFEGWPAVQFSGWPSVAVGTFGGVVALVDPTDNGMGKFRVVVVPDEQDHPWPDHPYLRQGVRANGWVLLDRVALGYEVWRRMNGFPPSLRAKGGEEKINKPPKVKI